MHDLTIRRATDDDLSAVIHVVYDDPPRDMMGIVSNGEQALAIGALLVRHGLEANLRRSVVAVSGGVVVGVMETMRPSEEPQISLPVLARVLWKGVSVAGAGVLPRYFRYVRARARVEIARAPESYYIAELDVHPDHRNRGVGGELLRHAEASARADCFTRMSLNTGITNPARHLYERHGFEVVETRLDAEYQRITGIPGRVLMVKELRQPAPGDA